MAKKRRMIMDYCLSAPIGGNAIISIGGHRYRTSKVLHTIQNADGIFRFVETKNSVYVTVN